MNAKKQFTAGDFDEVSDNPAWSAGRRVLPPRQARARVDVGIDVDIVERFQAGGDDWVARLNGALRSVVSPRS